MIKNILILLFVQLSVYGQIDPNGINTAIFQGGAADGINTTTIAQAANNIISGGAGNGTATTTFSQTFNNIFMGNIGDGNATTTYMQASNNLFVGGNSDGWSSTSLLQSTNNIFAGGNSDGWSETSLMQAGNSIYMGGLGDGWSEIYYKPMVALPVRFIAFEVTKKGNTVSEITWETATEANSAYFEIERGTDAIKFSGIGKVEAHQNSNEKFEYTFIDNAPLKGINYYRLKQVDLDGKYIYTPARALNFENIDANTVKYYPNPTNGILNIEISKNLNESKIINVFDAAGRVVNHLKIKDLAKNKITIDLSFYPKGTYFIHLKSLTINSTHRVILQ